MKKIFLYLVLTLCLTSFVIAQEKSIILQGSTTVFPVAQRCAEEFIKENPGVSISVRGGGSGVGISALIDKVCDIANSSRPMKKEELKTAISKGIDPKANVIANDAISVIVNPSNPISDLTLSQIKDIYTGKISNWKELGGENQKIVVVSRDTASGTFECFNEIVLKNEKVKPDALMQASNQAIVNIVKRTEGAIGYVGLGYLGSDVKAVKVNGIYPSKETVLNGTYPISRVLFMYTNGTPKGLVKNFIDFVKSKKGQEIVKEEGFVPLE
ncbi:MAG TPA: phosphate ABC transporter substrate-binding protein [bacterium]|nr:phosphate ABC transporter substrate-binding protein [bacterium]